MGYNIWSAPSKPLTEVVTHIVDNRGRVAPESDSGKILIATNCIYNTKLYPTYEKVRYVNERTYHNWFRSHPVPGDIIFVCKGTPGKVCLVPDPVDFCIAQDMVALRCNPDIIYNRYLLAVLRSREIQGQIYNTSVGDVIPHFKKSFFPLIEIPIPPINIQRIIGDLYFILSEKQELNKKTNDYLLRLATVLFESALDAERREETFGNIVELEDSKRIPLNSRDRERRKGPYPYYGATSIMGYVNDYLFDGRRILLGEDGSVITDDGRPVLQYVWGKYWVNNHAHILKPRADYSLEMLYVALNRTSIPHIVTGAVQKKISQKNLNALVLEMPNPLHIKGIDEIFSLYRENVDQNKQLEQLRDALLPKLMSGEIDVSQIELPTPPTNNHLSADC